MSKQFIKTNDGLDDVTKPKVKVYDDIAALQDAVDNGDVAEGEIVATKFVDNAQDDSMNVEAIENQISNINAMIPSGTSALNQLVNASQIAQMGSVSSVTVGSTKYSPDSNGDVCIPAYPDTSSFIDAQDAADIADARIDASGLANAIDAAQDDIDDIELLLPSTVDPSTSLLIDQTTLDSCGYVTSIQAGSNNYTPTSGVVTLPNGAAATLTLSGTTLTITL